MFRSSHSSTAVGLAVHEASTPQRLPNHATGVAILVSRLGGKTRCQALPAAKPGAKLFLLARPAAPAQVAQGLKRSKKKWLAPILVPSTCLSSKKKCFGTCLALFPISTSFQNILWTLGRIGRIRVKQKKRWRASDRPAREYERHLMVVFPSPLHGLAHTGYL